MNKRICHNHGVETILLFPDYSSTGMWCKNCGIGFANPKELFPHIPSELIVLVELWNDFWDIISVSHNIDINRSYMQKLINVSGIALAKLINDFHPCEVSIERCKL